jgi:hypothetical protein
LPIEAGDIYQFFFHGPAYQVLERAGVSADQVIAQKRDPLPPNSEPAAARTLMAPRLVELCFQAAALWSMEVKKAMAFPLGVDSVVVYQQEEDAGDQNLFAILSPGSGGESFDARVVDESGRVYVELRGYRTVSRPA